MSLKSVFVFVTQTDIMLGKRGDSATCPIALAAQRAGYPEAHVYKGTWNPFDDLMLPRDGALPLPDTAYDFVAAFDREGPLGVRPTYFNLPLP